MHTLFQKQITRLSIYVKSNSEAVRKFIKENEIHAFLSNWQSNHAYDMFFIVVFMARKEIVRYFDNHDTSSIAIRKFNKTSD